MTRWSGRDVRVARRQRSRRSREKGCTRHHDSEVGEEADRMVEGMVVGPSRPRQPVKVVTAIEDFWLTIVKLPSKEAAQ